MSKRKQVGGLHGVPDCEGKSQMNAPVVNPVDAALVALDQEVATIMAPATKSWKDVCDAIDIAADRAVNQILSTADTDDRLKEIHDRIVQRRSLGAGKASSADENLIKTCQYLLGFSLAALTFLLTFGQRIATLPVAVAKILVALGLAFVLVLLASVVILVLHTMQNRYRYPFLYFERIGNPWCWFYYGCISPETPRSPFDWPERLRFKPAKYYAEDFARFAANTVNESKEEALRADLQHYFLLMSFQGYSLQFELRTQNIFVYGVGSALFGFVIVLIGIVLGLV